MNRHRKLQFELSRKRSRGTPAETPLRRRRLAPAELFVGSFLILVLLGTLGFQVLPGLYTDRPLTSNEALFTATSAVCVTGLIVVDTATHFTFWGQAYLLLLIQLGGLGMLTLASLVIIALGGRTSLRTEAVVAGSRDSVLEVTVKTLIRDIVLFTLAIELVGVCLLWLVWGPQLGWLEALWPAVFHSVSAFCNAGFSTNTLSLMDFQTDPLTLLIVSGLITIGGLGFVTLEELMHWLRSQRSGRRGRRRRRLSIHTQLVLYSSGVLIFGGMFLFSAFEWNSTLRDLPWRDKLSNGLFMSITARTAGFNTIDYAQATDSTNFLTILLMMIGGSPGSTAGGLKTTTFVLIGLLAWSRLRSQATVTFANRSIPDSTIQRATGLFVISTSIVLLGIFALSGLGDLWGREDRFLIRMFEVVSAYNTVGLSMGETAELSLPGRWLIIVLMFVGRTGPLAIAAALVVRFSQQARMRLAYEDVNVG